jgi:hypothetical protein
LTPAPRVGQHPINTGYQLTGDSAEELVVF